MIVAPYLSTSSTAGLLRRINRNGASITQHSANTRAQSLSASPVPANLFSSAPNVCQHLTIQIVFDSRGAINLLRWQHESSAALTTHFLQPAKSSNPVIKGLMRTLLTAARSLVAPGCLLVLAGAALHTKFGYPTITAALTPSNLSTEMQEVVRAVFLLIGCNWLLIAIVAAVAAFTATKIRKAIVLICGLGLLLQIPLWVAIMGWFAGNILFLVAGLLITSGGLLFPSPHE